jgi:hypothetical protein
MELDMELNAAIIIMAFVVLAIVGMVAWLQIRMHMVMRDMGEHLALAQSRISTLEAQSIGRMAAEEVFSQSPSIGAPETDKQRKKERRGEPSCKKGLPGPLSKNF